MKIVAIDTSSNVCSVSIGADRKLISTIHYFIEKSHAEKLTIIIESLVNLCGWTLNDIEVFALSQGPGSYTGLRIASSTLKGYCYALDKKMIAIDTLQVYAFGVQRQIKNIIDYDYICPMIDARRMEVYTCIFNKELLKTEETAPLILTQEVLNEKFNGKKVLFCGDGAFKLENFKLEFIHSIYKQLYPNSESVLALAFDKAERGEFVDVVNFEPNYVKDFYFSPSKT
jgi:tRNA threonylcarbamoyladenosine biosynthesis protein TsaB